MSRTFRLVVGILIVLAVILTVLSYSRGETFTVRTADELTKALATTTQPDCNIVLAGVIRPPKTITIPAFKTFRMVGATQAAGVDFIDLPTSQPCNGVEINAANASLYGFTVKQFTPSGAAIKFNGSGGIVLSHLTFADISSRYVKPTTQPVDATGVHYGHCITSHGTSASLTVSDCTFRRCCWSSAEYSHCIYIHVPIVVVTDNTFDQCAGGALELYGDSVLCAGNVFKNGVSAPTRAETMIAPCWAYIPQGTNATYLRNALSGDLRATYFGWPDAGDYIKEAP